MRKILVVMLGLGFVLGLPLSGADTLKVEGLFYLDETHVSVSIVDGKIVQIERLQKNSSAPGVYIAPDSSIYRSTVLPESIFQISN